MEKDSYKDHLYALIVAGGGGTRLWPRSRNKTPKQFLPFFDGKTLTQITAERFNKMVPWERIFVVTTTNDYKKEVVKEVPKLLEENIIVEPVRKNTAPAHGLGALYIYNKDKDAVILNESADHLVSPFRQYSSAMKSAASAVFGGDYLLAVGIKPSYPNVGYGYIKRGKKLGIFEGHTVYKLDQFTEKPKLEVAKKYISTGFYTWNANEYVWRADSFLKALREFEPKVAEALDRITDAIGTRNESTAISTAYREMPDQTTDGKPLSIDFAVAEKAKNFLTISVDYNWTDIGDWKELWQNLPKDHAGNVLIDGNEEGGEILNIDTTDALIHKDGRLIAVVDVDNLIIVDTKDALLVTTKSRAQSVKKIVESLKKQGKKELL